MVIIGIPHLPTFKDTPDCGGIQTDTVVITELFSKGNRSERFELTSEEADELFYRVIRAVLRSRSSSLLGSGLLGNENRGSMFTVSFLEPREGFRMHTQQCCCILSRKLFSEMPVEDFLLHSNELIDGSSTKTERGASVLGHTGGRL